MPQNMLTGSINIKSPKAARPILENVDCTIDPKTPKEIIVESRKTLIILSIRIYYALSTAIMFISAAPARASRALLYSIDS